MVCLGISPVIGDYFYKFADMVVSGQPGHELPIQKKVLHSGRGELPQYKQGTKVSHQPLGSCTHFCQVSFQFVAKRLDGDTTLLDDSRTWTKPMEIIFGKKFKLESWEMSLETMRVGEVASFTTKRVYTHSYPLVAKTLRDTFRPKKPGDDMTSF